MENTNSKDLKNINMAIPNNLSEIKTDIETIVDLNETIIQNYLERIIYTSTLSIPVKENLSNIFKEAKAYIMDVL